MKTTKAERTEAHNSTAAQLVTKARAQLLFGQPFFGALALNLRIVQTTDIPTAGVDGKRLFYNPEFILQYALPGEFAKLIGLVAHEVMHCALNHSGRRQQRNHALFNIACDFAINQILVDSGFQLPDTKCLDEKYKGMSAEEIYNLLLGDATWKDVEGFDPGGCGGVMDSDGSHKGVIEDREQEREWKMAVAQAAHAAKLAGKLPAGLELMIDNLVHTTTPWRDLCRKFMTELSKSDYRWSRPSRRFIASGQYLPSISNEPISMGELVLAIDTSGSIDGNMLQLFGNEFNTIRSECRPTKTYVLWADAAVASVQEYGPDDVIELEPKGGGGTDFRPVFEWQKENAPQARAIIYLTDMMGAFPDPENVAIPTLWATATKDTEAPFGTTVVIEEKHT